MFLHSQAVPPEVMLAPAGPPGQVNDPLQPPRAVPTELTRSVGVQSQYRETEAQTDPYTPDYTIRPGEKEPEVLSLAALSFWSMSCLSSLCSSASLFALSVLSAGSKFKS